MRHRMPQSGLVQAWIVRVGRGARAGVVMFCGNLRLLGLGPLLQGRKAVGGKAACPGGRGQRDTLPAVVD